MDEKGCASGQTLLTNIQIIEIQFYARADGCKVWDLDGKEYIDMLCGYGPNILGYGDQVGDGQDRAGDGQDLNGEDDLRRWWSRRQQRRPRKETLQLDLLPSWLRSPNHCRII